MSELNENEKLLVELSLFVQARCPGFGVGELALIADQMVIGFHCGVRRAEDARRMLAAATVGVPSIRAVESRDMYWGDGFDRV